MINLKKSAEKTDVILTVALILLGIVAYFIFTPKTYKYGEVVFNNELTYLKKDMSLITGNIKDSIYIGEFVNGKKKDYIVCGTKTDSLKKMEVIQMVKK